MFTFKCHWFDNDFEEHIARGIVAADSYSEAAEKIDKRFNGVSYLNLNEYEDSDFIFLSKFNYDKIMNTEEGLDNWNE